MKNMKEDIDAICANLIDNSEPVSEMVFDLFNRTKKFANRRPSSLMADCIYIIMNAIGNPVSITLLSYVIKETLESKKTIRAMQVYPNTADKWYMTPRGKKAILEVIEEEDIYNSVMRFQNKG
tara:strand:+ start:3328 stop:3696 length:369 start_codon:yes stop_codon:yes gene_type:complete